jgi:hypothetical protein
LEKALKKQEVRSFDERKYLAVFRFMTSKPSGLRLEVSGLASSKWTEGGRLSSVTFEGEEIFINLVNFFFGKEDAEPIEVSTGVHASFQFIFLLYFFSMILTIFSCTNLLFEFPKTRQVLQKGNLDTSNTRLTSIWMLHHPPT